MDGRVESSSHGKLNTEGGRMTIRDVGQATKVKARPGTREVLGFKLELSLGLSLGLFQPRI
jgi:hypothetical protein